ncbi:putative hemolysin, partial [Vibrio parahaemolyticus AQ3810]
LPFTVLVKACFISLIAMASRASTTSISVFMTMQTIA